MNDPIDKRSAHDSQARLESSLRAALSKVADAVIATDTLGRVDYLNQAAERMLDCMLADALGYGLPQLLSIVDVITGEDIGDALGACDAARSDCDFRRALLLRVTEHPRVIEYSVTHVRPIGGGHGGAVIVMRDLMQRRESELALEISAAAQLAQSAALFEERERSHVTLQSIGDAVISTDFRGRITFLNFIAEKMTGWNQAEAAGQPLESIFVLVDPESRERLPCPAMQAIIDDRTVRFESSGVLVRRDGSELAVENGASPIHDRAGGVIGVVMVAHDVTHAREQAAALTRLALYDSLTGLPNRSLLSDRMAQGLQNANRTGRPTGLLFVDLDRFKPVNDREGHGVGDELLQQLARRLLGCVRSTDTVSRYGGDEFVIVLPDMMAADDALLCAGKIIDAVNAPFEIRGLRLQIGASVGIASYPASACDAQTLLKYADIAMYRAKAQGRNRAQAFSPALISEDEISFAVDHNG